MSFEDLFVISFNHLIIIEFKSILLMLLHYKFWKGKPLWHLWLISRHHFLLLWVFAAVYKCRRRKFILLWRQAYCTSMKRVRWCCVVAQTIIKCVLKFPINCCWVHPSVAYRHIWVFSCSIWLVMEYFGIDSRCWFYIILKLWKRSCIRENLK